MAAGQWRFALEWQQMIEADGVAACDLHWVCHVQGDIILVGLRDYQDEKADVILKCVSAQAL